MIVTRQHRDKAKAAQLAFHSARAESVAVKERLKADIGTEVDEAYEEITRAIKDGRAGIDLLKSLRRDFHGGGDDKDLEFLRVTEGLDLSPTYGDDSVSFLTEHGARIDLSEGNTFADLICDPSRFGSLNGPHPTGEVSGFDLTFFATVFGWDSSQPEALTELFSIMHNSYFETMGWLSFLGSDKPSEVRMRHGDGVKHPDKVSSPPANRRMVGPLDAVFGEEFHVLWHYSVDGCRLEMEIGDGPMISPVQLPAALKKPALIGKPWVIRIGAAPDIPNQGVFDYQVSNVRIQF